MTGVLLPKRNWNAGLITLPSNLNDFGTCMNE